MFIEKYLLKKKNKAHIYLERMFENQKKNYFVFIF